MSMKIMKKVSLLFILLVTSCTIYVERSANSSSVDSVSSSSIVSSLLSNTSISSYSSFLVSLNQARVKMYLHMYQPRMLQLIMKVSIPLKRMCHYSYIHIMNCLRIL